MRRTVIHVLLLSSVLACRQKDETLPALESAGTTARPAAGARITEPSDGDTVGPRVTIVLAADEVIIEPATGVRVAGRGHHHLLVDLGLTAPDSALGRQAGIVHLGDGSSAHTLTGLAPGRHVVIAVLGYGDHVPMANVASDTVSFVVARAVPVP